MQTCSTNYLFQFSFVAERQGGSSRSRRALVVMTATAWRCIPWRTAPRPSTITCSVDWARGVTSAPPGVAEADRGTGVSANRPSRTGIGDPTGTAPRARKETCQTWPRGPPSLRWRCGNRNGEPWLRCSSPLLLILTKAGPDIVQTQVTVRKNTLWSNSHRRHTGPETKVLERLPQEHPLIFM